MGAITIRNGQNLDALPLQLEANDRSYVAETLDYRRRF